MTTADWDFSGTNWSLDTTYYVSSPSSLAITPSSAYTSLTGFIKTSVVPNLKVREGRYITQFRVCLLTTTNHLKFYFRYQDANNYYMVDIHQVTAPGANIDVVRVVGGFPTTLASVTDPNWPRWLCWAVGGWDAVRITWTEDATGRLVIKVEKWEGGAWTLVMADVIDSNNYWASVGGRVGFYIDSYNNSTTNLDDGEIWGYF